ncbi:MAG: glucose-6-phosphate dehydrogenase [Pseudomonadales bacterium]|nr:glucose-6-phosphate dehydrogenase [Pseudomonadales bacterium]
MSKPPCFFVILGAAGNLVSEKLLPALYELELAGRLHEALRFLAFARRDWSQTDWCTHMQVLLKDRIGESCDPDALDRLTTRFTYLKGDYLEAAAYPAMKQLMADTAFEGQASCENIVFYLAIRPEDFLPVINRLHEAGFSGKQLQHRIVIEKPFGDDLETARMLNLRLHEHFSEEQIFRIDHYLGKETVQNMLVFRFANSMIEPIWNRNYIDHVQITVAENSGIGSRAGYFDQTGTLRDMVQNHLLQLLAVTAMEPPAILEASALQDEKVKVLRSIRPIPRQSVHAYTFRAQYGAGQIGGRDVPAYQQEAGVQQHSTTETYVAAKFYIDNWRWKGVPFYLRTGKRLPEKMSMISIRFKQPPLRLFRETPLEWIEPNWIVLSLYPDECMHLEIHAKQPGLEMNTRLVDLHAPYRQAGEKSLDAYETLLLDVIEGDRSLFLRFDEVEWSWRVVDPILRHWAHDDEYIHTYPAGSWGPEESTRLFDSEDQVWRDEV